MSNELHFAYQIKRHLNASARALPADKLERLRAIREQALAQHRPAVEMALSTGSGSVRSPGSDWLAQLVPVLVVAAALLGISYWHQSNRAEENADIDTQMLVDELPPSAYADKGFGAWIKRGQE